jgi:hypothetical protein
MVYGWKDTRGKRTIEKGKGIYKTDNIESEKGADEDEDKNIILPMNAPILNILGPQKFCLLKDK